MRKTTALLILGLLCGALSALAGGAGQAAPGANQHDAGFLTSKPAMIVPVATGASVKPIITTGDSLGSGYTFEAIPDGISFARVNGRGTTDILVNHELSLVPFPATRTDFSNALVSRLRLHQRSAGVLKGEYVIPADPGYQRFCSNFVVGKEHGFERDLLFTNEEARDIVRRREASWEPGLVPGAPGTEQAGVVVAYDVKSDAFRSIYGMGRHNHENSVAVPGYGYPVVLSGDDTFDAPASQLYLYKATSGAAVWNDQGSLYAFKSDNAAVNDYGDLTVGTSVSGSFIPVPRVIATGKKPDGSDITSADFPMPGVFEEDVPPPPPTPATTIIDGPQWVLEYWSNFNNVFQFIRIEDTAYDRTNPRIQYLADTGEPRAKPSATTTRLERSDTGGGPYPNGRIFKLVLNASDPLKVDSLSILVNGDALPAGNVEGLHQPDNVETTARSLMIQEDPGSQNQYALPAGTGKRTAAVWRYDLATGSLTRVALVDQSTDPTGQRLGAWESSGIVDASAVFGAGAFLLDVQAHGWEIASEPSSFPGVTKRRENGQLLLLNVPGA